MADGGMSGSVGKSARSGAWMSSGPESSPVAVTDSRREGDIRWKLSMTSSSLSSKNIEDPDLGRVVAEGDRERIELEMGVARYLPNGSLSGLAWASCWDRAVTYKGRRGVFGAGDSSGVGRLFCTPGIDLPHFTPSDQ